MNWKNLKSFLVFSKGNFFNLNGRVRIVIHKKKVPIGVVKKIWKCDSCGHEFDLDDIPDKCPKCGSDESFSMC